MSPTMKRCLITGALTGVSGWLLMISLIVMICRGSLSSCISSGDEFLFPAFIGAVLGGMVVYRFFGQTGRRGWLLAAGAAVVATVIGAFVGLIVLGVIQEGMKVFGEPKMLVSGPFFLFLALGKAPGALLIWGASMITTHLALRRFFQ